MNFIRTLRSSFKPKKYTKSKQQSQSPTQKQFYLLVWLICFFTLLNLFFIGFITHTIRGIKSAHLANTYDQLYFVPEYPTLTSQNLSISAKSAIVFEKESRVVVFEKEGNFRFAPASTTKIMSAIIALEQYDIDQYVVVPYDIEAIEGSKMGLIGGEEVRVKDLLYGMLLPSGNEAAELIASIHPRGKEGFVTDMNNKAKELKLFNTYFVDPSGYSDLNFTSAFDLARLASYALDNPTFREIVGTRSITLTDRSGFITYRLENLNRLLYNSDVFGIKTGFTNEAGEVLVTSYKSNDKTYIIVVLKSGNRFEDTEEIMSTIQKAVQLISY